ncbi:uncharacterized protein LOC121715638 isoform X3 [Alosa sapidissima]|uniref:uncharacterized protein LOC121715638 isoform X3 n=1 Tax=Alosa sapidissima TaxID=34773 RepID=UPI001C08A7EB|nr:uncharacterized protein LOC121715638 isoform X3 [Alosa sapidissima]XP_041957465.1 uncharacterized protein LOC121715638 isoform X3 [Alosa sapidissima]
MKHTCCFSHSKMEMHISTLQFLVIYILQTAGSPVSSMFRPTGGSVILEFQQHQHLERESVDFILWHLGLVKIINYVPHKGTLIVFTHKGRVEFNKETFSLELKNLQKNDSGLYRGEISAGETEVKAGIRLSVLDPVEAPIMFVVSSSDSSNMTVMCRGRDLSLTSTCKSSSCSPEGEASTDSTLTLSVRGGVVICNYSNPVSWKLATLEMKPLCSSDAETPSITMIVIPVIIAIAIVFVAGAAIFVYRQRSRDGATGTAAGPTQTEYAEVTPSSSPGSADPVASTYNSVQDRQPDTAEESPYAEICLKTLHVDRSSRDPLKNPSSNEGLIPQTASAVSSQIGGSVTLEFQQHQQLERESIDIIQWHLGQVKIMKYVPHKDTLIVFTHKGRVEFNNETFSLELKNLQKNDSGLYRGEISAGETEVQTEIRLSVLEKKYCFLIGWCGWLLILKNRTPTV